MKQLKKIKESYDNGIEFGRKGVDLYEKLPQFIIDDPDYLAYEEMKLKDQLSDSEGKTIKDFLAPMTGQNFIDFGCCLNLIFRNYDKWDSKYHGVDISPKTIQLLEEYVESENLSIGGVYCTSIHQTPFEDNFFDIGACVGVMEYYETSFIEQSLKEFHRIIKQKGKLVLDVPYLDSPVYKIAAMIEEHLKRPNQYNLHETDFEALLKYKFEIQKKEIVGPMIQYFLIAK